MEKVIEYNNFNDFIKKAEELTRFYENIEQVRYAFEKEILNGFYIVGKLTNEQIKLLGSKTADIKLSVDSTVKNYFHHPDLKPEDYKKIKNIITNPDEIRFNKKRNNCILLLKKDGKKYQVVIKTTKDKKENFLTSFRYAEH